MDQALSMARCCAQGAAFSQVSPLTHHDGSVIPHCTGQNRLRGLSNWLGTTQLVDCVLRSDLALEYIFLPTTLSSLSHLGEVLDPRQPFARCLMMFSWVDPFLRPFIRSFMKYLRCQGQNDKQDRSQSSSLRVALESCGETDAI